MKEKDDYYENDPDEEEALENSEEDEGAVELK